MKPPDPPTGYADPKEYHKNDYIANSLGLVMLVCLTALFFPGMVEALFGGMIRVVFGLDSFGFAAAARFGKRNIGRIVRIVGFGVVLIVVHEGVHYYVSKLSGYSPRFRFRVEQWAFGLPQVTPTITPPLDEYIDRRTNVLHLVAPLFVIGAIALIGLLPVFPTVVTGYAKIALILNTGGSGTDIYNATRVLLAPPGTRYFNCFDDGELRTFYTEPLPEARE